MDEISLNSNIFIEKKKNMKRKYKSKLVKGIPPKSRNFLQKKWEWGAENETVSKTL